MIASSWFKLSFNMTARFTEYSDLMMNEAWNLGVLRLPNARTNIDVTADFLRPIFESVLRICGPEDPARQPLILSVTYPITWPLDTIQSFETAVRRAGFGQRPIDRLEGTSEPMAAMYHLAPTLATQLSLGEGVVICGVGGGTTVSSVALYSLTASHPSLQDICSFRITGTTPTFNGRRSNPSTVSSVHRPSRYPRR
jgi:hypothetical protein